LQPSLFAQPDSIRSELGKIKTDQLTPLEALNILDQLKKKAEKEE
jgi:cell division protein ZapA (FtsZ GTPase activity inhibitor)